MIKRKFLYACAILLLCRGDGVSAFSAKTKGVLSFARRAIKWTATGIGSVSVENAGRETGRTSGRRQLRGAIGSDFRPGFAVRMVVGMRECEGPVSV